MESKHTTTSAATRPRLGAGLALGMLLGIVGCRDDGTANTGGSDTDDAMGTESGPTASDGTDSGATDSDGTDSGTDSGEIPEDLEPGPGGMRRLVVREYVKSIETMFGYDAAAAAVPPDDVAPDGFDAEGGSTVSLDSVAIEDYEQSAKAVATAIVADLSTLGDTVPCVTADQNDACYTEVATMLGRWAFRRALDQDEIDRLVDIALEGRAWGDGDFTIGLRYELMALLESPSFLYIVEVGEPDPASGFRRLRPSELATRLSFFLLGRNPDLPLLDRADAGELDTIADIRIVAEELIERPEARLATAAFFDELFRLRNVPNVSKSDVIFPTFSTELGEFMRQETLLLLHDIIWNRDGDFREIFDADYTFVNDPLAEIYGIEPPGQGNIFVQVPVPAGQNRAGFLTHASFLTAHANPLRNSPTKRGKFVQEALLCQELPPPDPDAELTLPDPEDGQTLKDLLEQHMENDGCRTCHAQFDPIGFAFESFDGIGRHRTTDNGSPVETDGMVPGIGEWANATDLAEILAVDERVPACLIENLIRAKLGRFPGTGEEPGIEALDEKFTEAEYSFRTLMLEFATSPLFTLVNEPR